MNCPYCQSSSSVKNGHASSGKPRWKCKKCHRTFSKDSVKGYPPTSVPFEFIAKMLYNYDTFNGIERFPAYVNYFLRTVSHRKPLHRTTVYSWVRKYGNLYMKFISEEDANEWFKQQKRYKVKLPYKKRLKKKHRKEDSLIDEIEKHKNFLKWLKEIGIKGKTLSVIKKYHPKLFEEFKEIYIENKIRENARKIHVESLSEVPEE